LKISNNQLVEKVQDEIIQGDNAINNINNDQIQYSTASVSEEQRYKALEDKIKTLEKTFYSKMNLMQMDNSTFKIELAALKLEKLKQNEENKQLRLELAKLKEEKENNVNNDLNYDSPDNKDHTNGDINYDSEGNNGEEKEDANKVIVATQQNKINVRLVETYSNPNYD
jgi:hypothetical protein